LKVLLVGSGGREHALALSLKASPSVSSLICAPGNPGIADVARLANVAADDLAGLVRLATQEAIDLVVVGPEVPLALGLADKLAEARIACFGPRQNAAILESSKAFTKEFCQRHNIPTASYATFTMAGPAKMHLANLSPPFVLKADGLAAGKGVVIAESRSEAEAALDEMFSGRFGTASARVVVEEFMAGEEVSVFALSDGRKAVFFGDAQDHKRVFDGDRGPNTGGMGAYSPAPVASADILNSVMDTIISPTVAGMAAEGRAFRGVLFAGIMLTDDGPKLVEFNARFGDPECQVLMARFRGDLALTLRACALGNIDAAPDFDFAPDPAVAVVMAAQGYPENPLTGSTIRGIAAAEEIDGLAVLHAGTKRDEDGTIRAAGGRVLTIVAMAPNLADAVHKAYRGVDSIMWPMGFCRRDIAWRALARG